MYLIVSHNVKLFSLITLLFITSISCGQGTNLSVGADELLKNDMSLIQNKRIGIITNQTGRLGNGMLLTDSLINIPNVNVRAIFSPEHGFFTNVSNGENVLDSHYKNVRVYSLYGKNRKINKNQLENIDILLFDIQDIGARFYTYISTLYYAVEAAAKNNKKIIVLDRPNPLGGNYVDGPMLKPEFISFIGIAPLPVVHGMTVGELALYFNDLIFHKIKKQADLKVIKISGWNRERPVSFFEHNWTNPSPNIPNFKTALIYPGTVFLEGTNVSEGRGTKSPFLIIGAPFIKTKILSKEIISLKPEYLSIKDTIFSPVSIKSMSVNPKYKNKLCYGIKIKVTNLKKFEPVKFGIKLIYALHKLFPKQFKFKDTWFDKLMGTEKVREMILAGKKPDEIISTWQKELKYFKQIRKKYLLY